MPLHESDTREAIIEWGRFTVVEAIEVAEKPAGSRMLFTGTAISLWATVVWLLNVTAYPSFNGYFPLARDIATFASAVFAVSLASAAARRPRLFLGFGTLAVSLAFVAAGVLGMFWASSMESPVAATLFACVRDLGSSVGGVFLICALVGMPLKSCATVLVCGYAGKYAWMALLWFAPYVVRCVALLVFALAATAMLYACARPAMRQLELLPPSTSLDVTNPRSFVPFTSRVFVAVLLFHAAFGFAVTHGSVNSYPQPTMMAFFAFVLAMELVLMRGSVSLDALFSLAFAFALLGMLTIPTLSSDGAFASLANSFLSAGSEVTSVVADLLVVMIAVRNPTNLLPVWFTAWCATAFGTELGAASGHLENYLEATNPELAGLFAVVITFCFVMFNYMLARRFSFDATVAQLQPAAPVIEVDEQDERLPRIDRRCAELSESGGLTSREAEVLALLARGRNVAYIQESLTLSRNTVKSYVARVYGKLDVHSHQELIDLVEEKGPAS